MWLPSRYAAACGVARYTLLRSRAMRASVAPPASANMSPRTDSRSASKSASTSSAGAEREAGGRRRGEHHARGEVCDTRSHLCGHPRAAAGGGDLAGAAATAAAPPPPPPPPPATGKGGNATPTGGARGAGREWRRRGEACGDAAVGVAAAAAAPPAAPPAGRAGVLPATGSHRVNPGATYEISPSAFHRRCTMPLPSVWNPEPSSRNRNTVAPDTSVTAPTPKPSTSMERQARRPAPSRAYPTSRNAAATAAAAASRRPPSPPSSSSSPPARSMRSAYRRSAEPARRSALTSKAGKPHGHLHVAVPSGRTRNATPPSVSDNTPPPDAPSNTRPEYVTRYPASHSAAAIASISPGTVSPTGGEPPTWPLTTPDTRRRGDRPLPRVLESRSSEMRDSRPWRLGTPVPLSPPPPPPPPPPPLASTPTRLPSAATGRARPAGARAPSVGWRRSPVRAMRCCMVTRWRPRVDVAAGEAAAAGGCDGGGDSADDTPSSPSMSPRMASNAGAAMLRAHACAASASAGVTTTTHAAIVAPVNSAPRPAPPSATAFAVLWVVARLLAAVMGVCAAAAGGTGSASPTMRMGDASTRVFRPSQ